MKLTKEQQKNLEMRIRKIASSAWVVAGRKAEGPAGEPANVKAARVLIEKYEASLRRQATKIQKEIETDCRKATETMLFEDPQKALQTVKNLERRWL